MSEVWATAALVTGLVLLWKGADLLVDGAVQAALRFGVSSFVIGLTIVAMGTSAPEIAASVAAVFTPGGGDIALGNVYGSNIANLALVGGVVALIRPLQIQRATLRREIPLMLGVALLLGVVAANAHILRGEALLLGLVFAGFLVWTARTGHGDLECPLPASGEASPSASARQASPLRVFLLVGGGLLGLAVGARLALVGAIALGRKLGLSEAVIGLTIVSLGTSLPELITCVVAALRGHDDISVGNLVGSNIFNTLLVTGVAGLCRPFRISARFAGGVDFWVMVGTGVVFAGLSLWGRGCIRRRHGLVLLVLYGGYLVYLFQIAPAV